MVDFLSFIRGTRYPAVSGWLWDPAYSKYFSQNDRYPEGHRFIGDQPVHRFLVLRSDLRRPAWAEELAGEESTELLDLLARAQSRFPNAARSNCATPACGFVRRLSAVSKTDLHALDFGLGSANSTTDDIRKRETLDHIGRVRFRTTIPRESVRFQGVCRPIENPWVRHSSQTSPISSAATSRSKARLSRS